MNRQLGMSLLEVLISLLLAGLIMTALMNHYLSTKKQYSYTQTALQQVFELELVVDLIRDRVRRAGFTPCMGINQLRTIDSRTGAKNKVAIELTRGDHSSLKINRMSEYFDSVLAIVSPTQLLAENSYSINRKHPVLIADCYHAEVQMINRVEQTPDGQIITLYNGLTYSYQQPIYIGAWIEETFFIRKVSGKSTLFYKRHHAEELSDELHTMVVQFIPSHKHTLLQIILGLNNKKIITIETMVRSS